MFTSVIAGALLFQSADIDIRRSNGLMEVRTAQVRGIVLYLPDDLRPGDTVSGSVLPDPDSNSSNDFAKALPSMVIRLGGARIDLNGIRLSGVVPPLQDRLTIEIQSGAKTSSGALPVSAIRPNVTSQFDGNAVCTASQPYVITGPFDGNSENTKISIGGAAAPVLAESPRSCIVACPVAKGQTTLSVVEGSETKTQSVRALQLEMKIDQKALLRGQGTTLEIRVSGLESLSQEEAPIPGEIVNWSPTVVSLANGAGRWPFAIELSEVKSGVWIRRVPVRAITPGSFSLSGILFCVSLHDQKTLMSLEDFHSWVGGIIIALESQISFLEKQIADKNGEGVGGEKLALERKRQAINELRSELASTQTELAASKNAVDKILKTETLFTLAAELVDAAADLLGYKTIPIDKVGSLLRGLRIVSSKLPKVLKLLDEVDKVKDAYDKIDDAIEKAKKAKEMKDLLEQTKKAISDSK